MSDHITNRSVLTYPDGAFLAENRSFVNVTDS